MIRSVATLRRIPTDRETRRGNKLRGGSLPGTKPQREGSIQQNAPRLLASSRLCHGYGWRDAAALRQASGGSQGAQLANRYVLRREVNGGRNLGTESANKKFRMHDEVSSHRAAC